MKKRVKVTLECIFEVDDEYVNNPEEYNNFEHIRNVDYDNVGRPLYHMEDTGWDIVSTEVTDCE